MLLFPFLPVFRPTGRAVGLVVYGAVIQLIKEPVTLLCYAAVTLNHLGVDASLVVIREVVGAILTIDFMSAEGFLNEFDFFDGEGDGDFLHFLFLRALFVPFNDYYFKG